jgi:hypothetical protein
MAKEKVGSLSLNLWSIFQNNSYNNILKMCHGVLYVHSRRGNETNGYLNRQWYDHINIVKDGQL